MTMPAVAAAAPAADPATPAPAPAAASTANDPWQPVNRQLFAVGMGVDRAVVRPIAHGYVRATPQAVRSRVSSVVYNLGEPSTALEDILQGRPRRAGRATLRFAVNSTFGVLGLFDVAGRWGVAPHEADFGQTLGRYGAGPGPDLYVPVVGPLNLRDGVGRVVDVVTDPVGFVTGPITSTAGATRTGATALDQRVAGDAAFNALEDSLDPYVTTRSAYSQYRAAIVAKATGEAQALPDFDTDPAQP
jgi:phospholipid-binding lipoprotein MlaA